jgi:hypothetical protein
VFKVPQFFDPLARVTFFVATQPAGSTEVEPWRDNADSLPPPAPLRRGIANNSIPLQPGDGVVHVSILTGERHKHGEQEELVAREAGMVREITRIEEDTMPPQRPLNAVAYRNFVQEMQAASFRFFIRQAARAVISTRHFHNDVSSIIVSYLEKSY